MSELLQRYGVFLNVENPDNDARDALRQTVRTGVEAEQMGFHDVWVAEHHYSPFAIGSALTVLLSHIAALTSTIRLGSGASLLALNDPLRVAEDIAALDLLSGGRIEFGVARGGPFPEQYRPSGIQSVDVARERMHEALDLIRRLWSEPQTHFDGRFFRYEGVAVYPRPLQRPMPVWLASLAGDSLRIAAEHGYGLMATPSSDLGQIAEQVADERARRGAFPFAIARFFHCDNDSRRAIEHGVAAVRAYPRLMGVRFPPGKLPPMFSPDATEAVILANAIIGDPGQCVARAKELGERLGPHRLLLKPATHDAHEARASLARFACAAGLI
ncbi:LLM class flavin-dependent oxidoreductase [Paraburkholderia unamae]|uniref:Alkanesulfonate monooxygenase SsuD/methylene tetrahydromethanopterin reductase-like flavin-dependent oxidoreductase (Luciferase family) n=1 Tax=Paraburkholderia unamae TaxID=219649 RepID=A0ABX5KTU0_9BURK|nr:LLM class flavin-dependent oxidoreductase [Paraburkholderia unamae]PVX85445.1 alkanesulfonate monooxygenase SsuD/methylene tetrahydromethanopterin reductase-like flavin-dependent oxidoreductase (luciferase family) [Paraburkholderia unamae]RAR55344.1 alkanesulfonate monooxygenase SsuD/methylene tetrahydromethanopterin reductase-like flavin-dependent oxidoreductase (luciferase family) [Paraburkholderia unamae]CAG9267776.1 Alkanesulfonate monooxygenase SsuD/methylene tetrahydromethanopterin redu